MALKMRATGLGSPVDECLTDFTVLTGEWVMRLPSLAWQPRPWPRAGAGQRQEYLLARGAASYTISTSE